jgi:uncharacterized protein YecE (DUF72 family)
MDFGKIDTTDLDKIDFTLPADAPGTERLLKKQKPSKKPEVFIGCAKWGRKDWVGKIYPKKTKDADFLLHYAKHFNCIELNATFYRIPTISQAEGWKNKVGKDFKFCPKFTDQITHIKRLKDAERLTNAFLEGIHAFGDNLGPVFLQTPPNYAPKNLETLEQYIEALPDDLDLFVELRHPQWFSDPEIFEAVFNMLEKHNVGAVITDASGRRDCVHMRLTTPSAFIRFVGNSLHPTDYTRCNDWVQRIKVWIEQGIQTIYFFMHQHEELYSPELCKYVIEQVNKECGLSIPVPVFVAE